jgi:single-strand DNA-binding protein
MARSINKVILLGNATRNPVLRTTKSGKSVCDFGIATNRAYTDDKGQRHEQAQFHNIVAWGKLAEIAGKYLVKGSRVYTEGRLETRDYEAADGQKKFRTAIIIDDLVMLDSRAAGAKDAPEATNGHASEPASQPDDHPNLTFTKEEVASENIPS